MTTNQPALRCASFGIALLASLSFVLAQKKPAFPEDQLNQNEYSADLRFLASDELMGRMTGSPWNDVASRYVAEQFRAAGLATFKGMDDYFQAVPLKRTFPPGEAKVMFLGDTLRQGKEMLTRGGGPLGWQGEYVYVGYGLVDPATHVDPYTSLDVKGKVVIARFGAEKTANQFAGFMELAEQKRATAAAHGAVALVELYRGSFPWRSLTMFLTRSGYELTSGEDFPHFLIEDTSSASVKKIEATSRGPLSIQSNGLRKEPIHARNVIGFIKGTDPKLSREYVLLTAHYDHIGTGKATGTSTDTIFNGARDNAMGTVALIAAAKSFAAQPPKRSVIIAAVTGEEIGEFGSQYLASNLPVPGNQVVFDLNTDGAGYDDTTIVTVIGLERTTAESALRQGSERYGLKVIRDPVPEQHLFDRSDNANFARLGIPSPNYSAGLHAFGPEILKYYHKAADQADESFNFSYFTTFCKAYVHSARLIADMKERPFWTSGDVYEKAGIALYNRDAKAR